MIFTISFFLLMCWMEDWFEVVRKCLEPANWILLPFKLHVFLCPVTAIKTRKKCKTFVRTVHELSGAIPLYSLSVWLCQRFNNGEESSLYLV